ncbi:MAG: ergothioneine biosynthesis protein EgtC [Actinocatenispora sp.]
MCRQLAYLGPPVTLASLLLDPPHSLLHQSYAPADMRGSGTINADGFGAGWYGPDGLVRYRRSCPLWSDPGFATLARSTRSGAMMGAVRSATVGMPVVETASAPFTDGRILFGHNGRVTGWPDSMAKSAERLPVTDLLTLDAPTDAALLWAMLQHRLRAGADLLDATGAVLNEVAAAAPGSRLNLIATDGHQIIATTWGHALSYLVTDDSCTVASEPLDSDERWQPVPDRRLLRATAETLSVAEVS